MGEDANKLACQCPSAPQRTHEVRAKGSRKVRRDRKKEERGN